MSLKSGRTLGLTASLIAIIVPVITVVLYGFFIFAIIAAVSHAVTGGGSASPFGFSFLSLGVILIALIALGLIGLIGLILFVVSMYELSRYYNEPGIFKNTLYALVISIVGPVALVAITFVVIISTIVASVGTHPAATSAPGLFLIGLVSLIAAAIAIEVVSALFYKRAFNKLGEKSGVHSFDTAGLLLLIGAALSIVGIGGIISWIAWIFAAMGFNALKPKASETSTFPYSTPQTTTPIIAQKRFCSYCGKENTADSVYCVVCGQKLQ